MPTAPLAIRQKTEAAALAYLQSRIAAAAGNALVSPRVVTLSLRQEVTNKILPRVVLSAPSANTFEEAEQIYLVQLVLYVGASVHESSDAGQPAADIIALHTARVGLLTEWFADRAAFLAFVNGGAVAGIRAEDIWLEEEDGDQVEQHWMGQLTYTVVAQLQNEP